MSMVRWLAELHDTAVLEQVVLCNTETAESKIAEHRENAMYVYWCRSNEESMSPVKRG